MIETLVKLAEKLDEMGESEAAEQVDLIIAEAMENYFGVDVSEQKNQMDEALYDNQGFSVPFSSGPKTFKTVADAHAYLGKYKDKARIKAAGILYQFLSAALSGDPKLKSYFLDLDGRNGDPESKLAVALDIAKKRGLLV